jgi:hypothetical protein
LVDAPHFSYRSTEAFIRGIYRKGDVGHAWIRLEGENKGKPYSLEGGHSGELGVETPRYFEAIANAQESEKNPIVCLNKKLCDGYFEEGSGGHKPTFSAKVPLTKDQFDAILSYIADYNFAEYSFTSHECTEFVAGAAAIAGLYLNTKITLALAPSITFFGETIVFWRDFAYSTITLGSPDLLEAQLKQLVRSNKVQTS